MDSLLESTLNAAALRPDNDPIADAFYAQELLRGMVTWHQQHEGEVLPTQLLVMLVSARSVC